MRNKKLIANLAFVLVIVSALAAYGFVSTRLGYPGKCDNETTWYMAGDTITKGMVVSIDMDYNAYTTGVYDTASVCIRSANENDTQVAGIALNDALPLESVQVQTRGVVAAKIDGSDSRGSGGLTISYGYSLSTADRDGYLGSIDCDSSTSASSDTTAFVQYYRDYRTQAVGYFVDGTEVAVTDTGALTTYDIYIDVRSRYR